MPLTTSIQGLNPCLLHWQVDTIIIFLLLALPGNPPSFSGWAGGMEWSTSEAPEKYTSLPGPLPSRLPLLLFPASHIRGLPTPLQLLFPSWARWGDLFLLTTVQACLAFRVRAGLPKCKASPLKESCLFLFPILSSLLCLKSYR